MEHEQGSKRSLVRSSRLPRPVRTFATTSQSSPTAHILEAGQSLRHKSSIPLRENLRLATKPKPAQDVFARNRLDETFAHAPSTPLVPGSSDDGMNTLRDDDDNSNHADEDWVRVGEGGPKRKPRPSLSERTVETLAQISPAPSPSRSRSSTTNSSSSMGPPAMPASALRSPIPLTTSLGQASSPVRSHQSASRRQSSPFKAPLMLDTASNVATLPTNRMKEVGSPSVRSSSGMRGSMLSPSAATESPRPHGSAYKVRSSQDLRAAAQNQLKKKASFSSVAQNMPASPVTQAGDVSITRRVGRSKKSSGTEIVPTSSSVKMNRKGRESSVNKSSTSEENIAGDEMTTETQKSKSSASLRETIAKAKAAKKQQTLVSPSVADSSLNNFENGIDSFDEKPEGISSHSLKRRIQTAVTTGTLNIAALGLTEIPREVLKMYDFDENHNVNWSEAVDLTKIMLSDNELQTLSDEVFPDWSFEEMEADENKSNQFGGLEVLDLRGNQLVNLSVGLRRLERLHILNLSNNRLTLDVLKTICQISSLRDLSLSNNNLSGVLPDSIGHLAQLQSLSLQGNSLDSLPLQLGKLRALQKLNLSNNSITTLPLNELGALPLLELNASGNRISGRLEVETGGLSQLQLLNLAGNEIESLSESPELPNLHTLILDDNRIELLPSVQHMPALTTITASGNKVEDLPSGFCQLKNLRIANFAGNSFRLLDPNISRMESLSTMVLDGNPLRDRKYLSMTTDDMKDDLAKRLTAIHDSQNPSSPAYHATNFDVEHADATAVRFKPEKGGVLNLSSQDLVEVSINEVELAAGPITSIRLSHNQLDAWPRALLEHEAIRTTLRLLDISHNPLFHSVSPPAATTVLDLPCLESLNLSSCGLENLDALLASLNAPALQTLNISSNALSGPLPVLKSTYPSLASVFASENAFSSLPVEAVEGLEMLDIRNNEIAYLHPKIGELGSQLDNRGVEPGKLRNLECTGNKFRVPRLAILEKGTEAVLRDLRRMVPVEDIGAEWRE